MSVETYVIKTPSSPVADRDNPILSTRRFRRVRKAFARVLRISAGLAGAVLVFVLIINWMVTPILFPKTSDAWMNAPISIVRAPSEGDVRIDLQLGESVKKGDVLASTTNSYIDRTTEWRLKTEKANLEAELKRELADLDLANRLRDTSRQEVDKYRSALMQELTTSLRQAEAKIAELTTLYNQSKRLVELNRTLSEGEAVSRDTYYRAVEDVAIAESRLEQSRAERDGIAIQLEAVKAGVFTQRDSPIERTWNLQIQQSLPTAEAKVVETKSRLGSVTQELGQVESFTNRLAEGEVISPAEGLLWRRNASSGPVAKGEPLFEIAEAQHEFIEAQFQESLAKSLYAGARAIIQFSGLQPLTGTVRAFRQTGPTDLDNAYAIRLPRRLNQLKVYIDIDIHRRMPIDSLVGRQCRVLVAAPDASPFGPGWSVLSLKRLVEWLSVKVFVLFGW